MLERVVEIAILAALPWPALAPLASREFRAAFPANARTLAALLGAAFAALGLVSVFAPSVWLRVLAAAALAVHALVLWHSSVRRGRSRGWPAGSLRPLPLGPWFDREFFRREGLRHGGVFKTNQFIRPMACVVGLPRGLDLLREHEASLSSPPLPSGRFIPGGFLRHMPPETHVATKEVFKEALSREVYEPLEPFLRAVMRAELERMAAESAPGSGEGLAPRRHIQRFLFAAWARLWLDVSPESPEFARLKALFHVIDLRNPSGATDDEVRAALAEITATMRRRLAARDAGASGPPPSFLHAMARRRPDAVEDPTVIGNLIYLTHFTWSDVSGLLVWVFRMLTEHPEWAERLRAAAPEPADALPLATRVVMETLRLEQSEHLYRAAERTIEHQGTVIPKGWLVRLCVRESHRDPAVFANPDTFDPDRFLGRAYTRREYSPFGAGLRHTCLGEGLTRFVGRVFAEELARGFTWKTVADGPHEYSAWRHWRPSSRWRVVVAKRSETAA